MNLDGQLNITSDLNTIYIGESKFKDLKCLLIKHKIKGNDVIVGVHINF